MHSSLQIYVCCKEKRNRLFCMSTGDKKQQAQIASREIQVRHKETLHYSEEREHEHTSPEELLRNLHRWRPLSTGQRNAPQQWVRADPAPRQRNGLADLFRSLPLLIPGKLFWFVFLAALLKRKEIVPAFKAAKHLLFSCRKAYY